MIIIGVSGTNAAGKDTVAAYFVKKGFVYHSLSDVIRDFCRKNNWLISREKMIEAGNFLREKYGCGYLAAETLAAINRNREKKSLAVSIRHPDEVRELRKNHQFKMIFVDAPLKLRFSRSQKRQGRPEDKDSFAEFKKHDELERRGNDSGQQLDKIKKLSDIIIINDGTIQEFEQKIEKFYQTIMG
ncbi:MAG: hypothetical protein CEN88_190 [Candidatus Berkelbacteria bacterium Licking1014_2]|uniref:Dephospho-CoA kinase n=1 Tax=Candidatus Berkelbacteria bacterium Licking1014_2 TaxID=2017146 RepID=A0A554LW47_9BACT|nr:MAG: hypothetical protein CEN88_190 [Candidatus Berkelbacteria bacterium Licking1014_2]